MATYIISYDLNKEGKEYEELYKAIKSYGTWAKINESVWVVVTSQSAKEVRDSLSLCLDSNDSIFVLKSGAEAAWRNVSCSTEWLKENL